MNTMEREPGQQESSPYNFRSNFEAAKEAMAYVEQGGWLHTENQIAEHWEEASEGERQTSLEGARRWLQTVDPAEDTWHTVYGDGGWDRWFVHADGAVRFSESHASPQGLQRAKEKGFWIE